jgi:2-polyprenyl-3-methyl-5-hydroxy-6-metoxy-1,4-benzoquinol methylase
MVRLALMFTRPDRTYDSDRDLIKLILREEGTPLNRICTLIPERSSVLDLGAGNGLLARVFKESGKAVVIDGIEPSPYASGLARPHYRRFYQGYAQDFSKEIRATGYDYVVLADVIEHLPDPLGFLQELAAVTGDRTRLVLSVPNVAFGAVRLALMAGQFSYVDQGLLERTHLRFFTLATLREMIDRLGLSCEKLYLMQKNILSSEVDLRNARLNPVCLWRMVRDDLAWTYQFVLVLTKERVPMEQRSFGSRDYGRFLRQLVKRPFKR